MAANNILRALISRTSATLFKRGFSITRTSFQTIGGATYKPNNFEKRMLVWTGKYKTIGEVPNFVNQEVMERCRNRVRIRFANIMMIATVFGCIIMVISGKRAVERGESVTKQNLDWHKQFNVENHQAKKE